MADVLQFPQPLLPFLEPADSGHHDPLSTPSDAEARASALDIRRSWIVEAPAGSGKTGLLIQRFLKLLAFGGVERPGEVLAITFTRKAAAELRSRVLEQLAAAAQNRLLPDDASEYERGTRALAQAVLARDNALNWQLLASPNELNIRTIDSFCGELAGSLPLLSGGTGHRRPVDDASLLYERAAERALRELGGSDKVLDEALRCVLLHRDAQLSDCIRLMSSMLNDREQWGGLVPLHAEELTEDALNSSIKQHLERTLERVVCDGISSAARLIPPEVLSDLARFAARLSTEPGHKGNISPLAVCHALSQAPGALAENLDHWLALISLLLTKEGTWRKSFAVNTVGLKLPRQDELWLKDLIQQLQAQDDREPGLREALCAIRCLPPARYPDDQWHVAKALFRVLRRALLELEVIFTESDVCDFSEIALTARRLLRSEPDLLALPGAQLTHLLVDEMQDTNAGQYELLELLTRTWDGATQTLFLVGDPKQSIYAFRQARVERFMRTQATGRLGDVPLHALRLTANFRSQAELVQEFNRTFELILPAPTENREPGPEIGDVPFVAALPTRPPGIQPALLWHGRLLRTQEPAALDDEEPDAERADPTADVEALAIRRIIEDFSFRWQDRPSEPGKAPRSPKIAVLARSRAHLAPIIEEFHRDRGHGQLPFRAVEIELLNERPEVLDLLALTRALLHPGDRIAWLAVLHSPVCGLDRADLLALTGEGPEADVEATVAHLVAHRSDRLSPEGQRLLARVWRTLTAAQAALGRTAFSTHVDRTWRSLGADALLRPDQALNTRRFFELLQKFETAAETVNLALLERRLQKLYATPVAEPDLVELMTIHKAKGLEWDLVLVPALERGTGRNQPGLLRWMELDGEAGEESGVVLAPIQGKGEESSALSKWLAGLERKREAAEAKRLFYVACTRAREELHLFAGVQFKNGGELRTPSYDSLLRASWMAAEPVLLRQLTTGQQSTADRRLPIGVPQEQSPPILFPETQTLALAASAEAAPDPTASPSLHASPLFNEPPLANEPPFPLLKRLPAGFDPLARFRPENGPQLPYTPASLLRQAAPFARPEGSFAARAFGNAVHRFLDLAARKLAEGQSPEHLLSDLPTWLGRVINTFRAEGLSPTLSAREAARALRALDATLRDPVGRWLLSPHPGAQSERALQLGEGAGDTYNVRSLRADRLFRAAEKPFAQGPDQYLWIVDFKTADAGGRSIEAFLQAEKAKYQPQLQAYAKASAAAADPAQPIMLALFYPLLTHLLYWPYEPGPASQ
ncbi:MAG: UvrD-helicase domain-containing protein [Janthinobacterium lividum]